MNREKFDPAALDPDMVAIILQKVIAMCPAFTAALAAQVESDARAQFGGQRVFVPKNAKRLTPEQRHAVFADGLSSMANEEISKKHNISRRTIYRVMKEGGGRFSE